MLHLKKHTITPAQVIIGGFLLLILAGTLLLMLPAATRSGRAASFSDALFTAASATCVTGLVLHDTAAYWSLFGQAVILLLIQVGGMGFFVWDDLRRCRLRFHSYSLQTKVVLTTTALLILLGALFFFFCEFAQPRWAGLTPGERALGALFQSVTPRTAGFNTVDLGNLSGPALLLTTLLMVVGGSPGSTAGGVKTTALALAALCVVSTLKNRPSIQCFRRRVGADVLRSLLTLLFLYTSLLLTGAVLLSALDGVPLTAAVFEAASAIGTVGLSLGVTPVSYTHLTLPTIRLV